MSQGRSAYFDLDPQKVYSKEINFYLKQFLGIFKVVVIY